MGKAGTLAAVIFTGVIFLASEGQGNAGECLDEDTDYVKRLEGFSGKGLPDSNIRCLGLTKFGHSTNRWAGSRAARVFAALRESPVRKRVARACEQILRHGEAPGARLCVRLLAQYGITKVGEFDVFALQSKHFKFGLAPIELAALGDRRATPVLMERFKADKDCLEQEKDDGQSDVHCMDLAQAGASKVVQTRRREMKIAMLNALWHLADPASRAFLDDVFHSNPEPLLRERAEMVLAHLPPVATP